MLDGAGIIPTLEEWAKWSMIDKVTYLGFWIALTPAIVFLIKKIFIQIFLKKRKLRGILKTPGCGFQFIQESRVVPLLINREGNLVVRLKEKPFHVRCILELGEQPVFVFVPRFTNDLWLVVSSLKKFRFASGTGFADSEHGISSLFIDDQSPRVVMAGDGVANIIAGHNHILDYRKDFWDGVYIGVLIPDITYSPFIGNKNISTLKKNKKIYLMMCKDYGKSIISNYDFVLMEFY